MPEKPESRRQDLKPYAYVRSGSIYAIKRKHLMKDNKRYGSKNSRPYILVKKVMNIDTQIDFITANQLLKMLIKNNTNILSITPIAHITGVKQLNRLGKIKIMSNPSTKTVEKVIHKYDAIFTNPNKSNVFIGEQILKRARLKVIATASTEQIILI